MKKKMSSKVISLFIMMVMMLSSIIMPFGENIGMLKQLVIHAEDNKTSSEELYREVLDMYYNNISTEWIYYCAGYYGSGVSYDYYNPFQGTITNGIGINSGVGYAEVSDIWWRHSKSNNLYSSGTQPLANTGYQFVDINSDGIDELLIGVISDYYGYGNYGSNVYDLYTIYNGKIIHIANSSDRCAFSVGNGVVITDGSGGGLLHGTEVNRIENGKLVPFEMYRYDAWEDKDNPYFFSDEIVLKQDGYYDSDNWKHITEKEYNSDIRSKYTLYSELEFVPFSDYKPSKIFKAPDWKRAYIDYIINNKPDSSLAWYINCSLVCIDEDDIPELCIVNSNSGETTILTFKDSNVTSTDFDKSKIASGTKTCDFYSIVDEINSYYYPADYYASALISFGTLANGQTYEFDGKRLTIKGEADLAISFSEDKPAPWKDFEGLEEVFFEKGTPGIGGYMFAGCTDIKRVWIPKSVEFIEDTAFSDCVNLEEINYEGISDQFNDMIKSLITSASDTVKNIVNGNLTVNFLAKEYYDDIDSEIYQTMLDVYNNNNFYKMTDETPILKTYKNVANADPDVNRYLFWKSFSEKIEGKVFDDKYNAKLTVQAITAELLLSEEFNDEIQEKAQQKMREFELLLWKGISNDGIMSTVKGITEVSDFVNIVNGINDVDDYISKVSPDKSKKMMDTLLKNVKPKAFKNFIEKIMKSDSVGDIQTAVEIPLKLLDSEMDTSQKIYNAYYASISYALAQEELKIAIGMMNESIQKTAAKYSGTLGERMQMVALQFNTYYTVIQDDSGKLVKAYGDKMHAINLENMGMEIFTAAVDKMLFMIIEIACPELAALLAGAKVVLKVGIKIFEITSTVDERAFSRDNFLNSILFVDALAYSLNSLTDGFSGYLFNKPDVNSFAVYKEGIRLYQISYNMMIDYVTQYGIMLEKEISTNNFIINSESINNISIIQQNNANWCMLYYGEKGLKEKYDMTSYELWTFSNSTITKVFNGLEDDLRSDIQKFNDAKVNTIYQIYCPVNLIIKKGSNIVASVQNDKVMFNNDYLFIKVIKEEKDTSAYKFVMLPEGYEIEISGYADGTMSLQKTIINQDDTLETVAFTNIPVTSGSTYTEIIEDGNTNAIEADLDTDGIIDEKIYPVASEEDCIEYEGEYHDLSWYLTTDGKFVISGTGDMHDLIYVNSGIFTVQTVPPWHENRDKIESIIIKEGITSIGDFVFYDCVNLKSVSIPSSVTVMGKGSFSKCENLKSVTIPTDILAGAFSECANLSRIDIPNSVKLIGDSAFLNTKWLYEKQEENPFVIINGILVDATKCSGNITIPNNVTSIGYYAFDRCLDVTSVYIPSSVVAIELGAFSNCTNLRSVTISGGVKTIESKVFFNCTSLERVNIPDSVTGIDSAAFYYCSILTDIVIPSRCSYIEYHAFMGCDSLKSIKILNPACEIYEDEYTISSQSTIYGYSNSTAQSYAEKNERNFVLLTPDSQKICKGDITGDNSVDILDVITINKAILGKETIPNEQLKNIDFNGNGKPDSEESLILLKYIVGLISVLP